MNTRSTWLLIVIALALTGYVIVTERVRTLPNPVPDYVSFDPARVQAVELLRSNAVVRVERTSNGWRMTLPVQYPAQATAVNAFVDGLAKLRPRLALQAPSGSESGGTNELREFGLGDSATLVKLETGETAPMIYQLGGPTPLGSQFYFRRVGAGGIYTADDAFLTLLPPAPDFWRDRGLFDLRGREFDRVEIRGPTAFTAVRDARSGTWQLVKPLAARADSERIEALINALQSARVTRFYSDSPLTELEPLGLQPAESELIVGRGSNDLVRLQFGRVFTNLPNEVLIRRTAQSNIVLAPIEAALLTRLPLANFRDRRLVPDLAGATEVRFRTGPTEYRLERNGTNWMVTAPGTFPADPELVDQFLKLLGGLEIVDFPNDVPADLARYGLDKPPREFAVLVGTNERIRLAFGTKLGLDKVYVRRADEPSVYATPLAELLRLPEIAAQLRDLRFDSTNVVQVDIQQKGRSRVLTRGANGAWAVTTGAAGTLLDEAVNETLYRLGRVASTRYVLGDPKQLEPLKFSEVAHTVTLKFRPGAPFRSLTFQFGGRNPVDNLFALVRFDEDPQPLLIEFPGKLYDDVFREFSAP